MDPSKRFVTLVLAAGVVVLLAAIALGERMGDRVLGRASDQALTTVPVVALTPSPEESSGGPYGPDWKRNQTLSAAGDPGFPDPRVPPKPLPTLPPTPVPTATPPKPARTYNPNIPIWDQTPIPSGSPSAAPSTEGSPEGPSPAAGGPATEPSVRSVPHIGPTPEP